MLLKTDSLRGKIVAISVSSSPDLSRLGFLEDHLRLVLAEVARAVFVSAGQLAYAGHFDNDGYTSFLIGETQRYSRRDSPLLVYSPEHEWAADPKIVRKRQEKLGLFARLICVDAEGNEVPMSDLEQDTRGPVNQAASLSGLRKHVSKTAHGRVLVGGRRTGFQGPVPGLVEEASLTLAAGRPLYLAAGMGGITADIAHAVGIVGVESSGESHLNTEALNEIRRRVADGKVGLNNGLDDNENTQLARAYRASEVAAFVSLGLGRQFTRQEDWEE